MGNIGIMDIDAQIVSDDVVRFAGPEMVNNGHFIAPDLQMVDQACNTFMEADRIENFYYQCRWNKCIHDIEYRW